MPPRPSIDSISSHGEATSSRGIAAPRLKRWFQPSTTQQAGAGEGEARRQGVAVCVWPLVRDRGPPRWKQATSHDELLSREDAVAPSLRIVNRDGFLYLTMANCANPPGGRANQSRSTRHCLGDAVPVPAARCTSGRYLTVSSASRSCTRRARDIGLAQDCCSSTSTQSSLRPRP